MKKVLLYFALMGVGFIATPLTVGFMMESRAKKPSVKASTEMSM